jgi:hypothetical protein
VEVGVPGDGGGADSGLRLDAWLPTEMTSGCVGNGFDDGLRVRRLTAGGLKAFARGPDSVSPRSSTTSFAQNQAGSSMRVRR